MSASVLVAACSSGSGSSASTSTSATNTTAPAASKDDQRLVIGTVLPQGGSVPDLGASLRAGVRLAVNEINAAGGVLGQPVVLRSGNEGDTPAAALLSVQDLLSSTPTVDAIIGPASSPDVLTTLATTTQAGVLTCSPTASAMSLDGYPDHGLFVRTVPSDSLQAVAIARTVQDTGRGAAAVVYLDDAYGRPFAKAVERAMRDLSLKVGTSVAVSGTDESVAAAVASVTAIKSTVVVVLADAVSGPAIIRAIDAAAGLLQPLFVVNDAIRRPDASVPPFEKTLGARVRGVSPLAYPLTSSFLTSLHVVDPSAQGLFAVDAYDCVNLIALAAQASGSTTGSAIAGSLKSVSSVGSPCTSFGACNEVLSDDRNPDYNGPDGVLSIDDNGNPSEAMFEPFSFDENGRDVGLAAAELPVAPAGRESLRAGGEFLDRHHCRCRTDRTRRRAPTPGRSASCRRPPSGRRGAAEQGDAPLEVVEAGRTGDVLHDPTGELATARAVLVHQVLALVVRQREPVGVRLALLATSGRSTTPAGGALRRDARVQAGVGSSPRACPSRTR